MSRTLLHDLMDRPFDFEFFQAVRLLEMASPVRAAVGSHAKPSAEVVRFRCHRSLSFPPSTIHDLYEPEKNPPSGEPIALHNVPTMIVAFYGMFGPQGALPSYFTETLMRLRRDVDPKKRNCLRDWLDLFNHRFLSLFFRAWEKYRFDVPFARKAIFEKFRAHPEEFGMVDGYTSSSFTMTLPGRMTTVEEDPFTNVLFCLIGLGFKPLRNRLNVSYPKIITEESEFDENQERRREFGKVEDLALLYYSGLLAQKPPTAIGLKAILQDYFGLNVRIMQFVGQWLPIDPENDARGFDLGINTIIGESVWDLMSKFRLRLGPLTYKEYTAMLPDPAPTTERKGFFLLSQLVRLYVGPEFDFELQLILKKEEVPYCRMVEPEEGQLGARLGWNVWIRSEGIEMEKDADEASFEGIDMPYLENIIIG